MDSEEPRLQAIHNAGWVFPLSVWDTLDTYQKSFAVSEFSGQRTLNYYKSRLEAIKFSGKSRVLDAACGMGQWSIALASLNDTVEGIDLSDIRINIAQKLASAHGAHCTFSVGRLEELPFGNALFDAVFCYGAFMFTDMEQTLREFVRILKPGGKIYLNANTWGWYAHLLLDRGIRKMNFPLTRDAARMIARTFFRRKRQIVVSERYLRSLFATAGVRILELGTEGSICLFENRFQCPQPAYPTRFYGLRTMLEVLGEVDFK